MSTQFVLVRTRSLPLVVRVSVPLAINPNIGADSSNPNCTETRLLSILPEVRVIIRSPVAPMSESFTVSVSPGT